MMRSGWLWLLTAAAGMSASGCVVETDCDDLDDDGICDDEECIDDDLDGICDDEECIDDDLNGICDDEEGCTSLDNSCPDPWFIDYCDEATGTMFETDCYDACTTDERVYLDVCGGGPAVTGECGQDLGACVCWCEDSFDQCVPGTEQVQYTREGTTFVIDCKDYCDGTCDDALGACACP